MPSLETIRTELERLMREQVEALANRTFLGNSAEELQQERDRLKRIRELSADFLEALKKVSP
jgi:hypothetical protein